MAKVETELQYLYRGEATPLVPTELAGLALAGSQRYHLVDSYYDTERLDLRRAGCTLRVRQAENVAQPLLSWKDRARRRRSVKSRREREIPLEQLPRSAEELSAALRRLHVWELIRGAADLPADAALSEIGKLSNDRSTHTYVRGLQRLELTWDRLHYPAGPDEMRLEVEVRSRLASRLMEAVERQLRALFEDQLVRPERGKVRELCQRLYPELMDG